MNELIVVATVAGLATMLAAVSAHVASTLAFDDKGNRIRCRKKSSKTNNEIIFHLRRNGA
jgi:hypothetical protein